MPGRAGGFYINPNRAGSALVFALVLGFEVVPARLRVAFGTIAGVGILMTMSRAGALLFTGFMGWSAWRRSFPVRHLAWAGVALLLVTGAVAVTFPGPVNDALEGAKVLEEAGRFAVSGDEESATDRRRFLEAGLELFSESPLIGHGTGASVSWVESASTHNQTLTFAVDHGIVGLLMWVALFVALLRGNSRATPFAVVFAVSSLFSHNLLDEFFSLTALAIAAVPDHVGGGLVPQPLARETSGGSAPEQRAEDSLRGAGHRLDAEEARDALARGTP
ncbi:MAG: O-antigen ligase family protein [Anaeromyxobacteraceae bacterium]